jgi:hypothetical protein
MYHSTFSEFSYGFALTDNIMRIGLPCTPTAPVFPSLIAEGSSGGGYDVQIPLHPVALFLQFKIPQVVRRRSLKMPTGFTKPYLRMHLRTKRPNQHRLLLDLEASGKVVAYATPDFWRTAELDAYFTAQEVHLRTRYFAPSDIGALDDKAHQVAYCTGNPTAWLFSEPHKLAAKSDSEAFGGRISVAVRKACKQEPLDFLYGLRATIHELTQSKRRAESSAAPSVGTEPHKSLIHEGKYSKVALAAREVAYLAQVRLGCTLVITGRKE